MPRFVARALRLLVLAAPLFWIPSVRANLPGGTDGTGANVTLTTSGSSFIMANGVVSITGGQSSATLSAINYTYNNSGSNTTANLLSGGHGGGSMYWSWTPAAGQQGPGGTYRVVVDPAVGDATHAPGDYAEVAIYTTWNGNSSLGWADVDVHYSMLRGSPGFYASAIHIRKNTYAASTMAEWRSNIYPGSIFNWINVDSVKTLQMASVSGSASPVAGAPQEVYLWTSGLYNGHYEDKYDYSADLGDETTWGWTSVTNSTAGFTGKNVGLWVTLPSHEYYNGGPMKKELILHQGPTELNMLNGTHYGMGQDYVFAANEAWTKCFGPYFVYCNSANTSITDPVQASATMFTDAKAQAAAEAGAWPYSWFINGNYTLAAGRGNITGRILLNDVDNPNASAAGLWVGVAQVPANTATYDFQEWCKNYQFWVKTDANGNFTIPNVIAGSNYTLYAFGPGAAGTFQSQSLSSSFNYYELNLPASPFSVTVTGGNTTALGNITWTPRRLGPTVFEIGVPDRNALEFRHGDDYWRGDIGPSPTIPAPVWGKHMSFAYDFPNGVTYTVGTSRWSTDWNWTQSAVQDATGAFNLTSNSTIAFNLASTPSGNASLFLGFAEVNSGPLVITVNGIPVTTTATPSNVTTNNITFSVSSNSTGYNPPVFSTSNDAVIRQGIHGAYCDNRINIPVGILHSGSNTINIKMTKNGNATNGVIYDYLRLEQPGFIPPAPAGVAAYANNNALLVSWPAVPGATSYNLLRSTTNGSGYTLLVGNLTGPVCGSGPANVTYLDVTAANGTPYYYVVQSVNPLGTSGNSTQGTGTPSSGAATAAPAAPTGVTATSGTANATVAWTASPGANYYTVQRATVVNLSGLQLYTTLSNTVTGTSFTDSSLSVGSTYSYLVSATNAAGTSANSTAANVTVIATAAPATPPANITVAPSAGQIKLSWAAISGATGYVVMRATSVNGTYTILDTTPGNTYTDNGNTNSGGSIVTTTLSNNTVYYYRIVAMNSAGGSANFTQTSGQTATAPPTISGLGGSGNVTLTWSAVSGAANYTIQRSTTTGTEATIASNITNATYTNTGLTNGTTYFYVVDTVNAGGAVSVDSNEVALTPIAVPANFTAAGNSGNVVLSWSAVTKAGNYTVHRGTVTGGPYSTNLTAVTGTNTTDSSVTNGTTYFYVVSATNSTINGSNTGLSISSNSTQFAATPVAAPANVSAVAGTTSANLSWSASNGATSYAIRRAAVSGGPYTTINSTISASPFIDTGLTNGSSYYYVVAAQATNGLSTNSTEVAATPIAVPAGVSISGGSGNANLTWSAAAGATGYAIGRATVSGGPYLTIISNTPASPYADAGLVNGTTYFYVVAGVNTIGTGNNSVEVSVTPLAPPANFTATPGNGNISLAWHAVTGAANYTVKRSTASGTETTLISGITGTSYKDTTTANGIQYFYTVVASTTNSTSNASAETSATPVAPPAAPTGLTATPGNTTVALNWTASANATLYLVSRSNTSGANYSLVTSTASTTYTDTGLTNGNLYYYVVAAQNGSGTSANSTEVAATPAQTLAQWTATYFPGIVDSNITGPAADPDNDGLSNQLEYLLGTNPTVPDSPGSVMTTTNDGSGNLVLTFRQSKNLLGLTYTVQQSTDLATWINTGVTPTVQSDQGTYSLMQALVPVGANPHFYLRLNITSQ